MIKNSFAVVAMLLATAMCRQGATGPPPDEEPQPTEPKTSSVAVTITQTEGASRRSTSELEILRHSEGTAQIAIERIVADDHIAGNVTGVASGAAGEFKVLVYVHTDQWYIHPYAGQGEGRSWARLNSDLTWRIRSVQRAYIADQVAALLVTADAPVRNTVASIDGIPSEALVVVRGNGQV